MSRLHREWVLDLYNLLLAITLFMHTWLLARVDETAKVDLWSSSIAIGIISLLAIVAYADWEQWANFGLGVWLMVSPWLFGFTHASAMHVSIGVGTAVAFLAILERWLVFETASEGLPPSNISTVNH